MRIEYEKAYRQGEILIFKVKEFPFYMQGKKKKNGVIREGEKEGHEHKVIGKDSQLSLLDDGNSGTLEVKDTATITHPEHGDIKLDKGKYVVKVQEEAKGKHQRTSVKD